MATNNLEKHFGEPLCECWDHGSKVVGLAADLSVFVGLGPYLQYIWAFCFNEEYLINYLFLLGTQ